ncbi:MAG: topoisomerase protein [Parcubacteria group bacterium GW2011_GWA1_47_11]|uniref:DNA topoisomerase 1 n=1 Tax=Candidatus Colwellbacteria bacterium GWA2_46_10 TaxID=1797684 RepID=A0A1G1YYW4_9BACT|nr:MAG: topoisomerase protein [Parcubacteria group bacterium GW2011_GWA2_46_10]KKU55800.1 MAG: topoisomerase protein [Parcubacteria group bacterium GW2011_GWA1_47_11]OGY56830.1 MAG: DNA topoisomerase I [Candidatus Colwellbacteria bacterium GWA2_46_10]
MKLVIVESPTKAKTLSGFLGKGYDIESSYGHVRDLPKGQLGVDIEKRFEPKYVIPRKAQKNLNSLKKIAGKAEEVILATDEDREGEAIAWHLAEALGLGQNTKRIVFHEITRSAIEKALEKPRSINQNLVDAQQARRVIDRLVGYKLSPFLWKKVRGGLSAGRVQSVALKLIVDRENEIREFKPQEYWSVIGTFEGKEEKFEGELIKQDGRKVDKFDIKTARDAQLFANDIKKGKASIFLATKKELTRRPLPPYITSTLQQDGSRKLGFSSKKTMVIAQRLYESGHITYMRTDSVNLSKESTLAAKQWLTETLGAKYAAVAPRFYKGKSKLAQEAHEAIRPTNPSLTPEALKAGDEGRLYNLIWRRFMASQMPDAKFEAVTLDVKVDGVKDKYILRATGSTMLFDGFLNIWISKIEEKNLPSLEKGSEVKVLDCLTNQHFTEPPARYNEASLIKTLEEYGIGRPSTYAPTISVIQDRGYVVKDQNKRFIPEEIGEIVNTLLSKHFPEIVDVGFTAGIEEKFDEIANGLENWQEMIGSFYGPFAENLDKKYAEVKKDKTMLEQPTDVECDKCGRKMVIKHGRFGKFMACPGFPECKNTKNIKQELEKIDMQCPECHEGDIVVRRTKKGRTFYGCGRYPDCKYASWKNPKEGESLPK